MPYSHPQPIDRKEAYQRIKHLLTGAIALSAMAGYVNSVVLGFFHAPVSHMTGAVSHLGLDLAQGRIRDALASGSIILGFLLGALVAGLMVGALKLIPGRRYGIVMMAEGLLLLVATLLIGGKHRLGLPAVAMACGMQNAMTSSFCGLVIRTTHVTGTVTDIGVMLGHWIRHRQVDRWKLQFMTIVVLSFGVGGWMGAVAELKWGPECLFVASVGMLSAGGVFWFVTHNGVVDLVQSTAVKPPRTGSFPWSG